MPEENYGYGSVDDVQKETSGGGKYLNFKKGDLGRVIQIRIASEPRYVLQHWVSDTSGKKTPVDCPGDATCPYCNDMTCPKDQDPRRKVAKWGWIVIDREDEEVKIFTGPMLIARAIKDISELRSKKTGNVMWGDPRQYDIQIERTEEPGKGYYKVDPIAEGKGDLTEEEKAKIATANFNLAEELVSSKKSDNTGNYGKPAGLEASPEETVDLENLPEDLGATKTTEEDMPF